MLRPLLFALLLHLKEHFKMKVMSWIKSHNFSYIVGPQLAKVCALLHILGKNRGRINIKTHFLQGKPLTL